MIPRLRECGAAAPFVYSWNHSWATSPGLYVLMALICPIADRRPANALGRHVAWNAVAIGVGAAGPMRKIQDDRQDYPEPVPADYADTRRPEQHVHQRR